MFSYCFAAVAFLALGAQAEQCYEEGAVWKTPSTNLVCTNGTWTATGCLTEAGDLLNEGDVIRSTSYFQQCQQVDTETMQIVTIGCMKNGRLLAPTQTMVAGKVYYTCKPVNRTSLEIQLSGCVSDDNQLVPFGEHIQVGSVAFMCTLQDPITKKFHPPTLDAHGCVLNQKTYMLDESANDDQYWYVCQFIQNKIQLVKKGCMDSMMRINPKEMFHSHGFLYTCVEEKGEIKRKGAGCLEVTPKKTIIEHSIGDKWLEGNDKVKYSVQCSEDDSGIMHKTPVQCYFTENDVKVDPGCMKKVGQFLYQCQKSGNGELQSTSIENPDEDVAKVALTAGFKFCK